MKDIRVRILRYLKENQAEFVSGRALGGSLNISRAAVWKQVQALRREGYLITARPREGYRLEKEPDRLDQSLLEARGIIYHRVTGSTNTAARNLGEQGGAGDTVIVAEEQLQGRGRRGRSWSSLPGKGLWFSLLLRPSGISPAAAAPVTLVTAAALAGGLRAEAGLAVSVKWPNDLLLNGKKIGGILTEMKGEPDRVEYLVIGIGLNINHQPEDFPDVLRHPATSLYRESGRPFNRTVLLLSLKESLERAYRRFWEAGFAPFRQAWIDVNVTLEKPVTVAWPGGTITGEAVDLDAEGALLVRDAGGRRHRISYGEII